MIIVLESREYMFYSEDIVLTKQISYYKRKKGVHTNNITKKSEYKYNN